MSSEKVSAKEPDSGACVYRHCEDNADDREDARSDSAFQPHNLDTRLSLDIDGYAWGQVVAGFRKIQESRMAEFWADNHRKCRFSAAKAKEKYAKTKDVERYCLREFDTLTTVWFSFVVPEKIPDGEWMDPKKHAQNFEEAHSATFRNLKRRLQDYRHAGVWLRAARRTGYTHLHLAVWIEADLDAEHFYPVVDSFIRNAPNATPETNPYAKAVRVNQVTSDDVVTPDNGNTEIDRERGATSRLPREIGGNIDALGTDTDIRDTEGDDTSPEVMHAALCFELGLRIWQPFGDFTDYADTEQKHREGDVKTGRSQAAFQPHNPDTPNPISYLISPWSTAVKSHCYSLQAARGMRVDRKPCPNSENVYSLMPPIPPPDRSSMTSYSL